MTPAAKAKGVFVGLVMVAGGVLTILAAGGMLGRRATKGDSPCATASACEAGCAKGRTVDCRKAGLILLQGYGVARSPERARGFFRTACDAGDPPGCTALGVVLLENTDASGAPSSEARAFFAKACDAGDAMGCNNLANIHNEGSDRDPARARALYEKACDRGSGMACSTLAKAFLKGDGVPADPARASGFFSRSMTLLQGECDVGNARACGQAGWLYQRGLGGETDIGKALGDYKSGCDGNDGASCYNLAVARRVANADDPTAEGLLAKACQLGLAEACDTTAN